MSSIINIQNLIQSGLTPFQITSQQGTIAVSTNTTGIVNIETYGNPIHNLPDGATTIQKNDVFPFENTGSLSTYKITAQALLGLANAKPVANYASTASVATLSGLLSIDGSVTAVGQTVLLLYQVNNAQNGLWIVSTSTWTRPSWYATGNSSQAFFGTTVQVLAGQANAGSTWYLSSPTSPVTIDTTPTSWSKLAVTTGAAAPAGPSGSVQYNNNNYATAGDSGLIYVSTTGSNAARTLYLGDSNGQGILKPSVGATNGYNMTVSSGDATSGYGGNLNLVATNAAGTNTLVGAGGVYITAGSVTATNNVGSAGNVVINAGSHIGTGASGAVNINAGNNVGNLGNGGDLNLTSGSANVSGSGGNINLRAGNAYGANSYAGSFQFLPGYSNGYGSSFSVQLGYGASSSTNSYDGTFQVQAGNGFYSLVLDQNCNLIIGNYTLPSAAAGTGGLGAFVDQGYYYRSVTPTNATPTQVPKYTSSLYFTSTATVTAPQTIKLPGNPADGQHFEVVFLSTVTGAITWQDSNAVTANVLGGPTTSTQYAGYSFRYLANGINKWVRRY